MLPYKMGAEFSGDGRPIDTHVLNTGHDVAVMPFHGAAAIDHRGPGGVIKPYGRSKHKLRGKCKIAADLAFTARALSQELISKSTI